MLITCSVVKGLGKNNIDTLLLTAPPYVIAVCLSLLNAWHADKTGERYMHIACPPVLAMCMYIVAVSTTKFAARYVAMCLMVGGTYSGYVVALGYISNSASSSSRNADPLFDETSRSMLLTRYQSYPVR